MNKTINHRLLSILINKASKNNTDVNIQRDKFYSWLEGINIVILFDNHNYSGKRFVACGMYGNHLEAISKLANNIDSKISEGGKESLEFFKNTAGCFYGCGDTQLDAMTMCMESIYITYDDIG